MRWSVISLLFVMNALLHTSIRELITMFALMCYQCAVFNERLITHFTRIRALTTTYALMCYQCAVCNECFITHITSITALTTMCVYVLSDSSLDWRSSYTLHKYKNTHHHGCLDVLSDSSYDCMPCYTLHMHMDAQPYVYHRNICIQHCVHDAVHSDYPGK